mmetsp:Transcript_21362/g.31706  ORF Transcript_21362/g.31706 Transcript_21362/m.31706 type:complete len:92 (-) Transcript_21362:384-659(-)
MKVEERQRFLQEALSHAKEIGLKQFFAVIVDDLGQIIQDEKLENTPPPFPKICCRQSNRITKRQGNEKSSWCHGFVINSIFLPSCDCNFWT